MSAPVPTIPRAQTDHDDVPTDEMLEDAIPANELEQALASVNQSLLVPAEVSISPMTAEAVRKTLVAAAVTAQSRLTGLSRRPENAASDMTEMTQLTLLLDALHRLPELLHSGTRLNVRINTGSVVMPNAALTFVVSAERGEAAGVDALQCNISNGRFHVALPLRRDPVNSSFWDAFLTAFKQEQRLKSERRNH